MLDEGSGQDQTLFGENYFLKEPNNKTSSGNEREKAFRSKIVRKKLTLWATQGVVVTFQERSSVIKNRLAVHAFQDRFRQLPNRRRTAFPGS